MKILVIGGGGREHVICWALAKSPLVKQIFCAPGNAGIDQLDKCYSVSPFTEKNITGQVILAKNLGVDLVVVGPEMPLVAGIVNLLQREKIPVFGPTAIAARIEGSKIICKNLLDICNIPTAPFSSFSKPDEAFKYLKTVSFPKVIKADGLAAGKGVAIVTNLEQAQWVVQRLMIEKKFDQAGEQIIIEDFLEGRECSLIVLTDGQNILPLIPARDYKRLKNCDQGPNTGGMGSYAPLPDVSNSLVKQIIKTIIRPIVDAFYNSGTPYVGALYAGLMITKEGPKVLEINCRFGDPETQVILPLLTSDFAELLLATINGKLNQVTPQWDNRSAVCVVLASAGYPFTYVTGFPISGLEQGTTNTLVFHSGTSYSPQGKIVTAGGRVLNIVGVGNNQIDARTLVYQKVQKIDFPGKIFRSDIAL